MSGNERISEIEHELGGVTESEAEALVKFLDGEIWVWQEVAKDEATNSTEREKTEKIVANLQWRRRLWSELAALEETEQAALAGRSPNVRD